VFLDESASNERTGDRKYGYGPIGGDAPSMKRLLKRSLRWSVLPAYTIEGYISTLTFQGGITKVIFENWLEFQVLPLCNQWPLPRSVIVLDNCSCHCGVRVKELCKQFNIELKYLPPYSPDFNPIEQSFNVLKAWIRRHYHARKDEFNSFEGFLQEAIRVVGQGPDCESRARKHFRKSEVGIL
jgi:transposase